MTESKNPAGPGETGAFEVILIPDLSPMEGVIYVCFKETTLTHECRGVTVDTTCIRHTCPTDTCPRHIIGLQCENAVAELFKVITKW